MTGRAWAPVAVIALAFSLAACGEKPQTQDASAKKTDAQPWSVSDAANPVFRAGAWKSGNKTVWEDQIRQRNQAQNDYVR